MDKWSILLPEAALDLAKRLWKRADEERCSGHIIFPPHNQVFRALSLTRPEEVRCVIVGQDPYHRNGQANGLAFSVNPGVAIPPSLKNILKELHDDIGCPVPTCGDLTPWATRGVLLLNTTLTVEEGKPNSHASWGWQDFVLEVLRVCMRMPQPIVFLLWGGSARAFTAGLQISKSSNKTCIFSSHPSPLGAMKGNSVVPAFIGSRPFSKTNLYLESMGGTPIDWNLV